MGPRALLEFVAVQLLLALGLEIARRIIARRGVLGPVASTLLGYGAASGFVALLLEGIRRTAAPSAVPSAFVACSVFVALPLSMGLIHAFFCRHQPAANRHAVLDALVLTLLGLVVSGFSLGALALLLIIASPLVFTFLYLGIVLGGASSGGGYKRAAHAKGTGRWRQ